MPRRSTSLVPADGDLARFALKLRALRSHAPADREVSVRRLAQKPWAKARAAAMFAALQGKTLPSRETLATLVMAWAPDPESDLPRWMSLRDECEAALAQPSSPVPASAATPSNDLRVAGGMSLGAEIRRRRLEAGISLSELSRRVMYSKGHLSKIETGRKFPTRDLVRNIEVALELPGQLMPPT
jgi:hypothetical protein